MNIVHISNTDSGGAIELHAAMLENGIDSAMLVAKHDLGYVRNIYQVGWYSKIKSIVSNLLSIKLLGKLDKTRGLFSYPIWGASLSKNVLVRSADVIYLHFVSHASFITIKEIGRILELGKPVIFMTRDMWPITGGCHIFLDCKKYKTDCKNCPCLQKITKSKILPIKQQKYKAKIYNKFNNLHFIGLSSWNTEAIRKSSIINLNINVGTIHNCLDVKIFKHLNKTFSRKSLNLPENKIVIGFGARHINNPNKGIKYLKDSLVILKETYKLEFSIVTYGRFQKISFDDVTESALNLGFLHDRYTMALFYNSLDVFVNPSLFETFGNTSAEALSCGIPVVGFKIGGLIDIIDNKVIGYLAEPKNSQDLATGIMKFVEKRNDPTIREKCRQKAVNNFSREVIFNKHADLWEQLGIERNNTINK